MNNIAKHHSIPTSEAKTVAIRPIYHLGKLNSAHTAEVKISIHQSFNSHACIGMNNNNSQTWELCATHADPKSQLPSPPMCCRGRPQKLNCATTNPISSKQFYSSLLLGVNYTYVSLCTECMHACVPFGTM